LYKPSNKLRGKKNLKFPIVRRKTNMDNQEIAAVEMTIEQAEARIAKMEKWEKLTKYPLFDELVTKDFLGDDAVRLVMNIKPTGENEIVENFLMAKSIFSRFVAAKIASGYEAISALDEHKTMLSEDVGE